MKIELARAGALTLALGMLGSVVVYASTSGCHNTSESAPAVVAEPSRSATSRGASKAPADALPPASGTDHLTLGTYSSAPKVTAKPARDSGYFMGASKAAPVIRGDQMSQRSDVTAPAQQAATPGNAP